MFHDSNFADQRAASPAAREARSRYLDRLTARFAYGVIAATVLIFGGQFVRYLIQSGALS